MEPPSPRRAVGVNPIPSTFIDSSTRTFSALIEERANKKRETTVILSYVKKQAASALQRNSKWFYLQIYLEKGETEEINGDRGFI